MEGVQRHESTQSYTLLSAGKSQRQYVVLALSRPASRVKSVRGCSVETMFIPRPSSVVYINSVGRAPDCITSRLASERQRGF